MAEKSIRFTTAEIRAILKDQKTMFRQTVAPHIVDRFVLDSQGKLLGSYRASVGDVYPTVDDAPYEVGDVLWAREKTFGMVGGADNQDLCYATHCPCGLSDDEHASVKGWRPSIHMPREAARIFLRVTDVTVEKSQDGLGWEWVYQFERITYSQLTSEQIGGI